MTKDHQYVRGDHTCDNSACPCHLPSAPTVEGWEKEFEDNIWMFTTGGVFTDYIRPDALKDFIRKTLSHSRRQVIEEIEAGLPANAEITECLHTPNDSCDQKCAEQSQDYERNRTLNEIRQLLTQLKKGE